MKFLPIWIVTSLLLTACAMEAPYVDHEYGMATRDAFERQILNKDYHHADKEVKGLPGIHAENVMRTYHETFTEGFTRQDIDISAASSLE